MTRTGWGVAFFLFLLSTAEAQDDSLVSIGDEKYLLLDDPGGKITYLRYPALGCPTILKPGTSGQALVRLADGGTASGFGLSLVPTGDDVGKTYSLSIVSATFDAAKSVYQVTYQIPATVPDDMYDLHLTVASSGIADFQPNSVRIVAAETTAYTFVVIADPQFNDPRGFMNPGNYSTANYDAATIIEQMKKEIRALKPTFAILCGDLLFGMDYKMEYEGGWSVWKDAGFPIFMVPGNHDGYATTKEYSFLGITVGVRDGLDFWRRYIGPTYYSFRFGGLHFQALNSYDGPAKRRDSFLIINENFGGDLSQEQMDWVAADATAAAGTLVPFMHHNPLGPYRPNGEFGLFSWVLARIWDFVTTGDFDDFSQTWNSESTAQFLKNLYAGVPALFIGHNHRDEVQTLGNSQYILVASAGSSTNPYWGYTYVQVSGGQISDYVYNGEGFQSIPTGNLYVRHLKPHVEDQRTAEIKSGLAKSYPVTLEFVLPAAAAYSAQNGTVVQVAAIDDQTNKVWVQAASPVAAGIEQPEKILVTVQATDVAGTVETADSPPSAGTGGSCGAPLVPGSTAGHLALTLLPLLALLGVRIGRRR